jgi:hypothetical protein
VPAKAHVAGVLVLVAAACGGDEGAADDEPVASAVTEPVHEIAIELLTEYDPGAGGRLIGEY